MQIGASIGTEEFCRYQRLFGFGEYTGIDLPGEGETSGLYASYVGAPLKSVVLLPHGKVTPQQ